MKEKGQFQGFAKNIDHKIHALDEKNQLSPRFWWKKRKKVQDSDEKTAMSKILLKKMIKKSKILIKKNDKKIKDFEGKND